MSVMVTMIGIIFATRFVYLDNRYKEIIRKCELNVQTIEEQREKQKDDNIENSNLFVNQLIIKATIGEYRAKREDSRKTGIWLDIFCLFMIIAFGILSTFGFFASKPNFIFLVFILLLLFLAPISHFVLHVRNVNKIKSV